jgi:hypothetical protein
MKIHNKDIEANFQRALAILAHQVNNIADQIVET